MDIMLDLETMGKGSNAAIIAIGAVSFDETGVKNEFYTQVNLESSVLNGGIVDASTVIWWMQQSDSARSAFVDNNSAQHINEALMQFSVFYKREAASNMWGCGAAFDNVILSNAYKAAGLKAPWPFWGDKCYRTVRDMNPQIEFERVGVHHNAVDDARTQALHLIKILNK